MTCGRRELVCKGQTRQPLLVLRGNNRNHKKRKMKLMKEDLVRTKNINCSLATYFTIEEVPDLVLFYALIKSLFLHQNL